MSTLERTREGRLYDSTISGGTRENDSLPDIPMERQSVNVATNLFDPAPPPPRNDASNGSNFLLPAWLASMQPIDWNPMTCRKVTPRGRNCCLFQPLGYCKGTDTANGFCVFHLKAVFNLVYQSDCAYQMDEKGKPVLSKRMQCFVAEPQRMDNAHTPVFPIFEMFDEEPRTEDIKMLHLARYLSNSCAQNWQRIYSIHVDFLHTLITIRSQIPRNYLDQDTMSKLLLHWNSWNEHHSYHLVQYPANVTLFYSRNSEDVRFIPLDRCTTITQMIMRLFAEPYSSLDNKYFYSIVSNYSFAVRNHLTYTNNLCSLGTTCSDTESCVGNMATAPIIRFDKCQTPLIAYTVDKQCGDTISINSKVNWNAPTLNKSAIVTNAACSNLRQVDS